MELTVHHDFSEISAAAWNELAAAGISDTPFARHEYLTQWWQTRGGGEWSKADLVLVSASEAGKLVGIAPLFTATHQAQQEILLVGSIEISDYLDLIVREADLPRFVAALLDYVDGSRTLHGLPLDWYNVPDSSPTLAALRAEAGKRTWSYQEDTYLPTPRVALAGGFKAFLAGLEKKQRHEIRRKMRRAAEGPAAAQFRLVESAAELEPSIDAFFQLMAHDVNKQRFLQPAMREHMRAVMRRAFENGYLWLAFLTVGNANAAAALNFDYKNKLWGYNSGVSPDFMELSPGWVLLAHQIQWASERGRSEFDFMRGDEEYKYRFGAVNRFVMRVRVSAA
jgi:CelD/BcsL family acetyltransferase involved in cellulose biosynthesis